MRHWFREQTTLLVRNPSFWPSITVPALQLVNGIEQKTTRHDMALQMPDVMALTVIRDKEKATMKIQPLILLSFVGGPLDGFDESVSVTEELPARVAIPMSDTTREIFGIELGTRNASRVAVYRLYNLDGAPEYRFQGMNWIHELLPESR